MVRRKVSPKPKRKPARQLPKKLVFLGYCGKCGRDVFTDFCDHCGRYVQESPHET